MIHGTFSYFSLDGWIPDPLFRIYTKNIHRTRHGSDSHIYDAEGRFIPSKFQDLFEKVRSLRGMQTARIHGASALPNVAR